jgi:hypothetical protein
MIKVKFICTICGGEFEFEKCELDMLKSGITGVPRSLANGYINGDLHICKECFPPLKSLINKNKDEIN